MEKNASPLNQQLSQLKESFEKNKCMNNFEIITLYFVIALVFLDGNGDDSIFIMNIQMIEIHSLRLMCWCCYLIRVNFKILVKKALRL